MDYYKLSNELRYQCQLLSTHSQNVFEVALNATILCESVTTQVITQIAQSLAQISKEINQESQKLLEIATSVCRYTLDIKRNYIIHNKFLEAKKKVDPSVYLRLEAPIHEVQEKIREKNQLSVQNVQKVYQKSKRLKKLYEKVWVALNNIKIEMSMDPNLHAFVGICEQIEEITHFQNSILININQFQKNLINMLLLEQDNQNGEAKA